MIKILLYNLSEMDRIGKLEAFFNSLSTKEKEFLENLRYTTEEYLYKEGGK